MKPSPTYPTLVEQAKARAVIRAVAVIQQAALEKKNWRAALAWLERMYPQRWGRKRMTSLDSQVQFEDKNTAEFLKEDAAMTPEERKRFIKIAREFEKSIDNDGGNDGKYKD